MSERERLLEGRKFCVDRVTIPTRGGGTARREYIVHPGAVVILPILDDGRVAMIRNVRHAVGETLLELPAGTLEPGEDPADCALRELAEETGYRAGQIAPLTRFYSSPGICDELMYVFVATGLTAGTADLAEGEQIEVELLAPEALDRAAAAGEIRDAKTLAGWLFYRAFRR